jgi:biopolymer transport protein ExbD
MREVAPFKRRPVSLTALIDVVFLLLLFFMLTSTFSTFGEIELNQPSGGQTTTAEPRPRAFVQIGAERLLLNGTPVALDTLSGELDEGLVLVNLDADVTAQRLVDLLSRLRGREALDVLVLE